MPFPYRRLTMPDRSNLRMERPDTPAHIGGLCLVEARSLVDHDGELDLASIRRRLELRLTRVPELRQVVYRPGLLGGAPMWIDDSDFSIERHVKAVHVPAPGDDRALIDATAEIMRPLLDRSKPLWELWFLTGLEGARVGILFKLHHAIGDGLASVAVISNLFDFEAVATEAVEERWSPAPAPGWVALISDNLQCRARSVVRTLAHPARLAREVAGTFAVMAGFLRDWNGAPRTSLNRIRGARRTFRVVRMDLETARAVAHAHQAKINDVLLAVVGGGMHEVLRNRRELVEGMNLKVSVPVALRTERTAARQLGNQAGNILVPLPIGENDPATALARIAESTRVAKTVQHPAFIQYLFAWIAALGLARRVSNGQRMVNFFLTNVPGPREPLYVLGARILDMVPLVGLAGNVTVMFAALSYCGCLNLVAVADVGAWPDVDVLLAGMEHTWRQLAQSALAHPVVRVDDFDRRDSPLSGHAV